MVPFGSMIRLWRSPVSVFRLQTTDIVEDKKYALAVTEIFGRKGIDDWALTEAKRNVCGNVPVSRRKLR